MRPIIGLNMSLVITADEGHELSLALPYVRAVEEAGGVPVCLPIYHDLETARGVIDLLDGFLFIGGRDYHPEHYGGRPQPKAELMDRRRDRFDMALARMILTETTLPVLGICGGCQLLWIVGGGALIQDVAADPWPSVGPPLPHAEGMRTNTGKKSYYHGVRTAPGSLLEEVLATTGATLKTNSYHHQAVHPERPARHLIICAWADDGCPEAVEASPSSPWGAEGRFVLGVQWHPERMGTDRYQRRLFRRFLAAAKRHGHS
ncbi:MAG: gamma-glutamyl-gamma-aminobutyrate hydrolase family protein [Syntrophales bacterium]|nr:gamma-glutamyl-gamma-aminobutyrate hydrolase family protein [Syntrophales bacterium]